MSELFGLTVNHVSAVRYNIRVAETVGWYDNLPPQVIEDFPDLAYDPILGDALGLIAFVDAVVVLQQFLGFEDHDCDGKFGQRTWIAVQKKYNNVAQEARWYLYKGQRLKAEGDYDTKLVTYEEEGGLDLHRWGHFTQNHFAKKKPQMIVIHWGGIDPKHCFRVFAQPTRKVSSHFGVGPGEVFQWLDLTHKTWHAGFVNGLSIGIDLCQQPTTKFLQKYKDRGYDVEKVSNPSDPRRGDRKVLTLDSRTVLAAQELLLDLCGLFDIPYKIPRGHDGLQETGEIFYGHLNKAQVKQYRGILFHSTISKGKWDIAPWLPQIFDEEI